MKSNVTISAQIDDATKNSQNTQYYYIYQDSQGDIHRIPIKLVNGKYSYSLIQEGFPDLAVNEFDKLDDDVKRLNDFHGSFNS